MKVVVGLYTGAYPSTTSEIGEVGVQFVPEPVEHMDFSQYPSTNNPWAVAIGLAILVASVVFGIVFT